MDWSVAKARIARRITLHCDLNTPDSTWREVLEIGPLRDQKTYGYYGETWFRGPGRCAELDLDPVEDSLRLVSMPSRAMRGTT